MPFQSLWTTYKYVKYADAAFITLIENRATMESFATVLWLRAYPNLFFQGELKNPELFEV